MSKRATKSIASPQVLSNSAASTTAYSQSPAMAQSSASDSGNAYQVDAESSKMASEGLETKDHSAALADFIFHVGYLGQNWADIHLTFFDTGVKLHRIVLARSPYLLRQMVSATSGSVHLTFEDDSITAESVHIALQHLYRPSQHLVNASNCRAVLATGLLFDGMPELVHHAYAVTHDSISTVNVIELVQWVNRSTPIHINGNSGVNGTQNNGVDMYGEWSSRLRDDVNAFLVHTLPSQADEAQLVSTYSQLPFEMFKRCVESEQLRIEPTQKRFAFAKKVIANRKKAAAASQMEEAAVLAMQEDGMAVVVTRKPKKGRNFFKVEG